jgi:hypothetical protein
METQSQDYANSVTPLVGNAAADIQINAHHANLEDISTLENAVTLAQATRIAAGFIENAMHATHLVPLVLVHLIHIARAVFLTTSNMEAHA